MEPPAMLPAATGLEVSASEAMLLRELWDGVDEGFCIIEMLWDAEGRPVDYLFLAINPAFEGQTGLRDAQGRRMREMEPNHEQSWFDIYGNVARTGEPTRFEHWSEQLQRWFSLYAFRLRQNPNHVAVLFNDCTARKRAEQEVERLSAERSARVAELEALLAIVPVGIAIASDAECQNIRANPTLAAMLGIGAQENASKTALPEEIPQSFRVVDDAGRERPGHDLPMQVSAREGVEKKNEEVNVIREDGEHVRLLMHAVPLFDAQQQPRGSVAGFVDITARRREEQRTRFVVALDDALRPLSDPDVIVATAARLLGEHLQASRCAYADVEADEDTFDLVGDYNRGVQSIKGRYTFKAFGEEVRRLMRANQPYVVHDIDTHQPPPEAFNAYRATEIQAVICVPLHKGGKLVAAMAVHQRVPRTWREEEVALVLTVANRCWEAMQRARVTHALQRAKEQAEAGSRAKDDFLAALSHELRTPLTPVLMAADDLCNDPSLPAPVHETLSMMRRNIALEARLIDDLLDLTRVAAGKLALRRQTASAHEVLGFALEIVEDEAQAKGLKLEVQLAAQHPYLSCDPPRLQQVFWNLLKNAVKFTPQGGRITVQTSDDQGHWVVEVSDTGLGIAPEALERIFDPFEQAGLTNNHRFGGLGLGLSIAKAIVEMHEGRISARSAGAELGSTFRVRIPHVENPPAGAVEPLAPVSEGLPMPNLRLLLVEDHEATLAILSRLLRRQGHTVVTAATAAEGRKAAALGRFDGVISDIGLPDSTGIELMSMLHRVHGLRGIALSGYGMEEDLRRSQAAGFIAHLVKPVELAQLRRALELFVPERRG